MKLDELARVSLDELVETKLIIFTNERNELFELLSIRMKESVDRKIRSIDNIVFRHHGSDSSVGIVFVGNRRRHRN